MDDKKVASYSRHYNEAREARSAKPFFPWFSKGKNSLFITGHARRVGCLFIFSVCLFLCCVRQHRNRPPRSTAFNAHGTNASPNGLCARTHNNEAFSCWSSCKSFRVGRARRGNMCCQRHSWAVFKKLGTYILTKYKYKYNTRTWYAYYTRTSRRFFFVCCK